MPIDYTSGSSFQFTFDSSSEFPTPANASINIIDDLVVERNPETVVLLATFAAGTTVPPIFTESGTTISIGDNDRKYCNYDAHNCRLTNKCMRSLARCVLSPAIKWQVKRQSSVFVFVVHKL